MKGKTCDFLEFILVLIIGLDQQRFCSVRLIRIRVY